MADIRLQDYTASIKDMIRSVRLDEAIAHCRHILRHYPKHIETYCLLGEACLEKQMYREAIEFFQRTLGADPENLMARVGLGIIYDEQGAFPEAIWQLERAFELVPGNAEVRRELLRLYNQYDAIDKTRLKLTRGALGRLYSRNGLYERAITEFRAILRRDPELPDIRVALVEALWHEGRQVEAVENCLDLLDALPNCLKANLILGDIWLRGGNEESARQRLDLARSLDPENRVAQELMGADSPLPAEQVLIPELDAMPEPFDFAAGEEPGPGIEAVETIAAGALDAEEHEPWGTDEELPEWLRDVGVTADAEPALDLTEEELELVPRADEAISTEGMPEWLQEVMEEGHPPAGEPLVAEGEFVDEEVAVAEEALESLQPGPPEVADEGAAFEELMATGMWEEAPQEPAGTEMPAEEMPEWLEMLLGEAGSVPGEMQEPEIEEVAAPPVLEIEGAIAEPPAVEIEEEAPAPEEEVLSVDEVPDWGRDLEVAEVEEAAEVETELIAAPPVAQLEEEESPALEEAAPAEDEIPDWLRDLGVAEVEEVAEIETEVITAPPVAEIEEEEALAPEEAAPAEDELPDWLSDLGVAEVEEVAEIETEVIAAPPVADIEEEAPALDDVALTEDELPDWLRDLGIVEVEETAEAETEVIAAPPVAEIEEEEAPALEEEVLADDEIPDWVRELDVAKVEEGPVAAEEVPLIDEIPDWLRDLDELEVEEVAGPPTAMDARDVGRETEIPASLLALVAAGLLDEADLESAMAEMSEEDLAAQRAEEIPHWLSELVGEEAPSAAEAEPTPSVLPVEGLPTPVIEMPAEEVLGEEAPPQIVEIEPEPIEESVPDAVKPVEEAFQEEPAPEIVVEEPEPVIEDAALDVPEPEPLVEEVVPEPEEPMVEVLTEESVSEAIEVEPEPLIEESVPEAAEPVEEVLVEEAAPDVVLETLSRTDELLQQLRTRPRDYSARLELARLRYAEQDWDAALTNYEKLISARRFLPDVVDDLESLVDQDVELARVYHMLGDAYMQQDRLDDALKMYRLARQKLTKR